MKMMTDVLLPDPDSTTWELCLSAYRMGRRWTILMVRHSREQPNQWLSEMNVRYYRNRLAMLREYLNHTKEAHGERKQEPQPRA